MSSRPFQVEGAWQQIGEGYWHYEHDSALGHAGSAQCFMFSSQL
jgi:hypothetical protein